MEGESGLTQSIIDQLHSWDIKGDQMEGESGGTPSIIGEPLSSYIRGVQMEGDSGITRSIIDDFHAWISNEIKRKVKVV